VASVGRVALICMPFAAADLPPLGVSILKPLLERADVRCDIHYINLRFRRFTERPDLYDGAIGPHADRVFREALFGEAQLGANPFLAQDAEAVLDPKDPDYSVALLRAKRDWCRTQLRPFVGPFLDDVMKADFWKDYGLIGFSLVFSQTVASVALARCIKERWPKTLIALGGPACDAEMGGALLKLFPFVDWAFSGEADLSFPQAVFRWSEGRSPAGIPGVTYRDGGEVVMQGDGEAIDLDTLPDPDFGEYFAALRRWAPDLLSGASLSAELSRGCWWAEKRGCIFCGLNRTSRTFRCKDPTKAAAQIARLRHRYGVEKVHCTDTVLDSRAFETVLPALAASGRPGTLFVETRPTLSRRELQAMKQAGVTRFQPGIESLDTSLLTHMCKGTSLSTNVQLLKWSRVVGLAPHWGFLYGFPGEDREAYARIAALVPSLLHLNPPDYVIPIQLHRFSPLFELRDAWGLRNVKAAAEYRMIYPFDPGDLDQLAYDFDYDFDGKADVPAYTHQARTALRFWQQCWTRGAPPSLVLHRASDDTIVLRDSRPRREEATVRLEGESALIYLVCDERQKLEDIASAVRCRTAKRPPGDAMVRACLEGFVSRRLMLRDGPWYLSLATDNEIQIAHGLDPHA